MEILYEKYENVQQFIIKYRKYQLAPDEKFYEFADFKKNIQIEQFIRHKCINTKKNRVVFIYMFKHESKYIKTTSQFKRLMDKLPMEPADVIIISKNELSVYINKSIIKYKHLTISNYMHKYFSIELSNGPLCSPHTILTNNEVRSLCSRDLIVHPLSLPAMSINDPQNVWIGGELGQIIRIKSVSEITGRSIRYRIISPDSGKMINIQKLNQSIDENAQIKEIAQESQKNDAEADQTRATANDDMAAYIDEDMYDDDDMATDEEDAEAIEKK